jgi:hypothetical protein
MTPTDLGAYWARPAALSRSQRLTVFAQVRHHFLQVCRGGQGGIEPPTFRFSGAIQRSQNVADRGRTCYPAASTVAHGRPASVAACLRWLPFWLPASGHPAVVGLHISGLADRCAQLAADRRRDRAGLAVRVGPVPPGQGAATV